MYTLTIYGNNQYDSLLSGSYNYLTKKGLQKNLLERIKEAFIEYFDNHDEDDDWVKSEEYTQKIMSEIELAIENWDIDQIMKLIKNSKIGDCFTRRDDYIYMGKMHFEDVADDQHDMIVEAMTERGKLLNLFS